MQLGGWAYLGIFTAALVLAWGLTPVALKIATNKAIFDRPGDYKVQRSPIPYLGGAAIVAAFSVAVVFAAAIKPPVSGFSELLTIMALALALGAMGLVDDLHGLNPFVRLIFEVAGAVTLFTAGVRVEIFDLTVLNLLLTALWVAGITNAFNLLDNMDGLSAGIAAISSFFFFLIAAINGQFLVAGLAAALTGCAIGFLRHNFHPAKIYMGDAGSLYLGFLLAVLGIKLRFDAPEQITFMVPILVLGVAIFDTVLVTATRLINRKNPWSGGRDHTSHRIVFVGISVPVAVALIYAAQVALGWLALIMSRVDVVTGYLIMGFVLAIAMFFGILLAFVPVYEQSKRRRLMIQEVKEHEVEPEGLSDPGAPRAGVMAIVER